MGCRSFQQSWASWGAAAAIFIATEAPADRLEHICTYLDVGVGASRTQPFITGSTVCGTIGFGASTALFATRLWLEFRATGGQDIPASPEASDAGKQSIVTFLGGLEVLSPETHRGLFLVSGLGLGHSTISGAHGPTNSPSFGIVPLEDRTAVAYGLGLGYRFPGGPWSSQTQLALRAHGLFGEWLSSSAYAAVLAIGFGY